MACVNISKELLVKLFIMFEKFFGSGNEEGKRIYTGEMKIDPDTSEVVTPEELERRTKEKMEGGREQK